MDDTLNVKKDSMIKGVALLSLSGFLVKIISLLYTPIINQILGDEGIGVYGAVYQIFTFMYILTTSGLPNAISKSISEQVSLKNYKDAEACFKLSNLVLGVTGFILAAIMFIFSKQFAVKWEYPRAALAIKVISPSIFVTAILCSYRGYFQGKNIMKPTAVSQVVEQVFNLIFSLGAAYILISSYGVEEGVAGGTVGTTIGALIAVLMVKAAYNVHIKRVTNSKRYKVSKRKFSNKALVKRIIRYAVPITICVGIQNLGLIIDPMIVKSRLIDMGIASNTADMYFGWIYKYNQLIFVPITITVALGATVLPAISGLVALKDRKGIKEKVEYAIRLCFLVSMPSAVGLSVLAIPICGLLKFTNNTAELLNVGAWILIPMAVVQLQTTIMQGVGSLYTITIYSTIGLIAKIIANYFLIPIPWINVKGALIGSAIGFLIPLVLNHLTINKATRCKISLIKSGIKPLLSSFGMGIVVYITYYIVNYVLNFVISGYINNAIATVAAIFMGMFSYAYFLIVSGELGKKELNILPSKVTKLMPDFMLKRIK